MSRGDGPARASLSRLQGSLAYQQLMLADARRNRAFARALEARVRPGAHVLDLGSGSGVWAVLAARLGARRVVAVEREAVLVPVIEALAREAGVAERVEVVRADARRVRLLREFDVVVGELVGNEGFEEALVPVFARARALFLRQGGALVPEAVALVAAPVEAPHPLGVSPPIVPATSLVALTVHAPRILRSGELKALAPGLEFASADLRKVRADERLPVGRVRFRVKDAAKVGGIAVWVRMRLAPKVELETRAGTHWLPIFLPIDPLPRGPGALEVEIDWDPDRRRWSLRFEGRDGSRREASYSPLFAWGAVRGALARR